MHDKNDILSELRKEAKSYIKEPRAGLPRGLFEQRSYQKWAVQEVIKRIEESRFSPPTMVVENFLNEMNLYSCKKTKASWIFSVAYDTASWVMDILLSMKGE